MDTPGAFHNPAEWESDPTYLKALEMMQQGNVLGLKLVDDIVYSVRGNQQVKDAIYSKLWSSLTYPDDY